MPSPQAIREFKDLYFRRYGVQLSDAEAAEQASRLLKLYKAVYGPGDDGGATQRHATDLQP